LVIANQVDHKAHVPHGWIIRGLRVGLILIVLFTVTLCVCMRSSNCLADDTRNHEKCWGQNFSQIPYSKEPKIFFFSFFFGFGR